MAEILAAIGSGVAAVGSAVGSAASTVGSVVGSAATAGSAASWAIPAASLATSLGTSLYTILTAPGAPKPPDPLRREDPMKAAYAEMQAIRKRKGAASTILTGPEGSLGQASTLKTQLG